MMPRADFLADQFLRQQLVPNLALEVLEILPGLVDFRFQRFHAGQFVLLADRIQSLDDIGIDVDAVILGALHEQGLIDQIAKQILIFCRDLRLHLFRGAIRAFSCTSLSTLLARGPGPHA